MDNPAMILSALMSAAILIMIAPNIIRMNKGRVLQNIALWVAIFLGLALAYQTLGPGKDQLLPDTMQNQDSIQPETRDVMPSRT